MVTGPGFAAADLNNDGVLDFAGSMLGTPGDEVIFYLGNGDGFEVQLYEPKYKKR